MKKYVYVELETWSEQIIARKEVSHMSKLRRIAFAVRWNMNTAMSSEWFIRSYSTPQQEFEVINNKR